MSTPRILVLTAAGKIGVPVVLQLLDEGFPVTAFVHKEDGRSERLKAKGAEWLLYLSPMIRQGTIYAPYGAGKAAFIAAEDQGRVIAHIIQDPKPHQGQIYPLYGPVEYTFPEVAAVVGRALGRDIAYQQVPFEVLREAFTAGGENVARNDSLTGYAESNRPDASGKESHASQHLREAAIDMDNGLFSGTNDLVEQITGRSPMTLEDVASAYRAAFV